VPEGDTIHRTADTLRRWLGGRTITAARVAPQVRLRVGVEMIVGGSVQAVESVGKHLLITVSVANAAAQAAETVTIRTHNVMTGSWHVYPNGVPWKRPARQARLVIECGERVAVLFNAPVIELTRSGDTVDRSGVEHLGPDIVSVPLPIEVITARARVRARARAHVVGPGSLAVPITIAELLLDQRVTAGIGNIYRCETLFLEHVNPHQRAGDVDDELLLAIFMRAHHLLRANLRHDGGGDGSREFGLGPGLMWVYQRTGRPCRTCGTAISSELLGGSGSVPRRVYWCPTCQTGQPPHRRVN
jgi:endonuclease VIII